jgi:hypothetical protein
MRSHLVWVLALFVLSPIPAILASSPQQPRPKSAYEDADPADSVDSAYSPLLKSQLIALRDAALSSDYAYQQVAHLTENIGPRPEGSPQAEAAVQYVADEMRKLGLEVQLQEVWVPRWVRGAESAELTEYPGQVAGTTQKIVLTALGGNTPTPAAGLSGDVIVVDNWDQLKALGRSQVTGRIVLFNAKFDKEMAAGGFGLKAYEEAVSYRGLGARTAADLGAAACLVRSVGNADYRLPHTGWSAPASIPSGAVTAEDADLLADLTQQGKVRMHLVLTSQTTDPVLSHNVVADLKGSEHPEQVVIVSGHLDSWDLGTGAIDDAAGVAVAMEAAQLIQQAHLHPRRTIRVIAWMDEENGGSGNRAYAAARASQFADHVAAIESDLGASHPLGFEVKVIPSALPLLRPVQNILQSFGASMINLTSSSPGSDIAPLAKAGVPTLGIIQDARTYFNYHHTAADTLDKIIPRELRENAAAMAVMGYALASLPEPLPR